MIFGSKIFLVEKNYSTEIFFLKKNLDQVHSCGFRKASRIFIPHLKKNYILNGKIKIFLEIDVSRPFQKVEKRLFSETMYILKFHYVLDEILIFYKEYKKGYSTTGSDIPSKVQNLV